MVSGEKSGNVIANLALEIWREQQKETEGSKSCVIDSGHNFAGTFAMPA